MQNGAIGGGGQPSRGRRGAGEASPSGSLNTGMGEQLKLLRTDPELIWTAWLQEPSRIFGLGP